LNHPPKTPHKRLGATRFVGGVGQSALAGRQRVIRACLSSGGPVVAAFRVGCCRACAEPFEDVGAVRGEGGFYDVVRGLTFERCRHRVHTSTAGAACAFVASRLRSSSSLTLATIRKRT
jgi:hypothetical protein